MIFIVKMNRVNNLATLTEMPLSLQHDFVFKRLFMEAKIANYSEEEAIAFIASMKDRWDRYAEKTTGRIEGEIEGKISVARIMKSSGEPVDKISKYTGLSIEEIDKL